MRRRRRRRSLANENAGRVNKTQLMISMFDIGDYIHKKTFKKKKNVILYKEMTQ